MTVSPHDPAKYLQEIIIAPKNPECQWAEIIE
jgi:hypothetical protein